MTEFKETDLYEPIRAFLEEEGYQVQAEVKHCDIACLLYTSKEMETFHKCAINDFAWRSGA